MEFDAAIVRTNVRAANTLDLLDRATVYRAGMEPEAVFLVEDELRRRGVSDREIEAHAEQRREETQRDADGTAKRCSFCDDPACAEGWDWHRLHGWLPVFPRLYRYCAEHRPERS